MELRAHPNIASANLELLANVVSHHATDAHDHEDSNSQLQPRSDNQHDNETIINSSQNAAVKREWRRRLIIKRDGLDEAIKLLDQHGTALS